MDAGVGVETYRVVVDVGVRVEEGAVVAVE